MAGGRDPSGRPEKQRDRQKEPLAAESSHGDGGLKAAVGAGQQHQEPPSVIPADGLSPFHCPCWAGANVVGILGSM